MTAAELDFYLISNLYPKTTGLPFVVWILVKGHACHDVRVKVALGPRAPEEFVSVAIRPEVAVVEGEMKAADLTVLRRWIELNEDVLLRYWNEEIDTAEAVTALRPPSK